MSREIKYGSFDGVENCSASCSSDGGGGDDDGSSLTYWSEDHHQGLIQSRKAAISVPCLRVGLVVLTIVLLFTASKWQSHQTDQVQTYLSPQERYSTTSASVGH
uniref:Uncharacterized protein n=1 Tax=Grammatophora oceanica TaxID=210454 RepID=A0A7S1VM90_9STRA|mmetsp:Transcript_50303/g.75153  ORF Transcript_50303/g.75153 Transcript_50303/m.75153 type:complete len:104 (+) Transcript_50303:124-435(+)